MAHTIKILGTLGALLSLLGLAACASPTPTSAPTLDQNPLRTEVAATVLAQVTLDLALTPSITPLPSPTATLPPTSMPTETATQAAEATPEATLQASPAVTGTLPAESDSRAEWVSQTVPDDSIFALGETFTMTWRIKNVGTTTWNTGFMLRFYSGDAFSAPKEVLLTREVLPGDTVDITLRMKAPTRPGSYRSVWVMSTDSRSNFKEPIYLQIVVQAPPTATRAP